MKVKARRSPPRMPKIVRCVRAGQEAQAANDKERHPGVPVSVPAEQGYMATVQQSRKRPCKDRGAGACHSRKCTAKEQTGQHSPLGTTDHPPGHTHEFLCPCTLKNDPPRARNAHAPEVETAQKQKRQANSKQQERHHHGPPWQQCATARQRPAAVARPRPKMFRATETPPVDHILVCRWLIVGTSLCMSKTSKTSTAHQQRIAGKNNNKNEQGTASNDGQQGRTPSVLWHAFL